MNDSYMEFMPIFKALADETRLKIIDMLSCGEMCANDILEEFQISQSTLSYHMKVLMDAGLINGLKDGNWMRYSLKNERTQELIDFIVYITSEKEDCICRNIRKNIINE